MYLRRLLGSWYDIPFVKFFAELFLVILPVAFLIRTVFFGLYQVPTGSMETTLLVGERFIADKLSYWFRKPTRGEIIAFNAPDASVCSQGFHYSKNAFANWFQRYVWGPDNWTKRLIGIPGDHIVGKIENGHPAVYLNDSKMPLGETYVNKYPLIRVWRSHPALVVRSNNSVLKTFDPNVSWENQIFSKINPDKIILNEKREPFEILASGTPTDKDIFDVTLKDNQYWVMGDNRLNSGDSRMWGILDGKLIHGRILYRIWSMDSDESWWFIDLIKNPIAFWKKIRWSRCFQFVS